MRKNKYIRLLTILLITIIATILVCNIYRNYENNKLNNSYIAKYVTNISINDLSNAIVESGDNTFVYFGVTGDDNFYKMEKELKKSVINYHMEDEFLYVDANKMKVSTANELFDTDKKRRHSGTIQAFYTDKKIQRFPAIVYLKNGSVLEILDSSMHTLNSSDFNNLLDTYEVKDNE